MKILIGITLFIIVSQSSLFAQDTPGFITDSLDIYITRGLERWQVPGAAVLIVKDGQVVVSKGYGVKESGSDEKVNENTLFMIGSNTKAFTGTALALLEHENKISMEDKVIKYLPDFRMKEDWITKELNLNDIVTHRMGFETFQGDFMYWSSDLTAAQAIEKFGQLTPKYDFRTKYGYTNAGYAVAGKVIEKVSGMEWKDFMKQNIFLPLGMERTTALSIDFPKAENISKPHTIVNNKVIVLPFEDIDNLAPCGSMGSSVNELSHWLFAQLDSGKVYGNSVLPFQVIEQTRQPHTIVRRAKHIFNRTNFHLYGLGWALQDYEGWEIISHTGGVNGFVTSVTMIPALNLGVVVLTNTDQNVFYQTLKWEIIDSYLELPYRNYDAMAFERHLRQIAERDEELMEWRDSVAMYLQPDVALNEFSGRYFHDIYGFADLSVEGSTLILNLEHHSNLEGKLEHIGNNRFLCTYSDPLFGIRVFPFKIEDGKVKYFDLFVDNFIEFLPYRFYKE